MNKIYLWILVSYRSLPVDWGSTSTISRPALKPPMQWVPQSKMAKA